MNEIGVKYGYLTTIEEVERSPKGNRRMLCRCECGVEKIVYVYNLKNGHTQSCGCFNRRRAREANTIHGHATRGSPSKLYTVWSTMIARCHDPKNKAFPRYGGRGIFVCLEWKRSFECFLRDVGEHPSADHSLDRIDNNRGYEPGNVRWATRKEQARNKRSNRPVIRGDGILFPTIVEAFENTPGSSQSNIRNTCAGLHRTCAGFSWRYA